MKLDLLRSKPDTEPLSDRLWRRYGRRAFDLLEAIRADPAMGEDIMGSADYLRAELYTAAEHEMIVTLDDFMRRRSKIDLVVHDDDIHDGPGLREVAEILFGARRRAPPGRLRGEQAARRRRRRDGLSRLSDLGCRGPAWAPSVSARRRGRRSVRPGRRR